MVLMQATKSCNGRGNVFEGLGDSGANVHIANKELFENLVKLGYKYKQEIKNKRINTVGKESFMKISGWINIGGYIEETGGPRKPYRCRKTSNCWCCNTYRR